MIYLSNKGSLLILILGTVILFFLHQIFSIIYLFIFIINLKYFKIYFFNKTVELKKNYFYCPIIYLKLHFPIKFLKNRVCILNFIPALILNIQKSTKKYLIIYKIVVIFYLTTKTPLYIEYYNFIIILKKNLIIH
jgi:hypothetical protein